MLKKITCKEYCRIHNCLSVISYKLFINIIDYYIYSHVDEIGHNVTTTLESNVIPESKYCLLFNYHIRGLHVEKLEVKLIDQSTAIWYQDTDQGVEWKCATINVTIGQPESRVSPMIFNFKH